MQNTSIGVNEKTLTDFNLEIAQYQLKHKLKSKPSASEFMSLLLDCWKRNKK